MKRSSNMTQGVDDRRSDPTSVPILPCCVQNNVLNRIDAFNYFRTKLLLKI